MEISRILGLLLTKCETSLAPRCGKHLWEANYDPLPENNKSSLLVPVETALAIYHDSSNGRQTYSLSDARKNPVSCRVSDISTLMHTKR